MCIFAVPYAKTRLQGRLKIGIWSSEDRSAEGRDTGAIPGISASCAILAEVRRNTANGRCHVKFFDKDGERREEV